MTDLSNVSELSRAQMAAAKALQAAREAELAAIGPERALARRDRLQAEIAHRAALKAYNDACDNVDLQGEPNHQQPGLFE